MASCHATNCEPAAPHRAVPLHCFERILRTRRREPARWRQHRRNEALIPANDECSDVPRQQHQAFHGSSPAPATFCRQISKSSRSVANDARYASRRVRITTSQAGRCRCKSRRHSSLSLRRSRLRATPVSRDLDTTNPRRARPASLAVQKMSRWGRCRRCPVVSTRRTSMARTRRRERGKRSAPSDACVLRTDRNGHALAPLLPAARQNSATPTVGHTQTESVLGNPALVPRLVCRHHRGLLLPIEPGKLLALTAKGQGLTFPHTGRRMAVPVAPPYTAPRQTTRCPCQPKISGNAFSRAPSATSPSR